MLYKSILIVLILVSIASALDLSADVLDNKIIRNVNRNPNLPWKAARNERFEGKSIGEVVQLMGTKTFPTKQTPRVHLKSNPSSFDSREQWPGCVHAVLNQEQCGSCWAFSTSESVSDRFCIASGGKVNVTLSPQALVSCDDYGNDGCGGGLPSLALAYVSVHGLPTYSCVPYTSGNGTNGKCIKDSCADGETFDLYKTELLSIRGCSSVECIQNAVIAGGPVVATMNVYQDFISYTSGVYVYDGTSQFLGGHAIEIVGWGYDSSSNLPYWIVKNSWSDTWGIDGYFWIELGVNMCGIDSGVSYAEPKL